MKIQRGRPVIFKSHLKRHLACLVAKFGLTGAQTVARLEGITISLPTLRKISPNVQLVRGPRVLRQAA